MASETETASTVRNRPWTFVHVTDIHIGSERSYRYNPAINENWETARRQIRALAPDLLLVGGDIARDGNIHDFEFAESCASIDELGIPWHVIPGNMDTGNKVADRNGPFPDRDDPSLNITQELIERFARLVRPSPWSFDHRGVRFSGFYEIITGSGLPCDIEARHWLDGLAELPPARAHVMLNHYPLFVHRPDEPLYELTDPNHYHDWYFGVDPEPRRFLMDAYKRAGVTHVLSGHIHCRRPPVEVDGIVYCKGPSTAFPQFGDHFPDGDDTLGFQLFTVSHDSVTPAFVPLTSVSRRRDARGPGGHPKPEARVYPDPADAGTK
ncbi:MAG: metallophosphoesterase [Opitutaceae bacterium]